MSPRRLKDLPLLALLLGACGGSLGTQQNEPQSTVIRTVATLPGEDEMLRMEEERWTGEGRLKKFLLDTNPGVRRRAAVAAGRIGDRSILPELKRLMADKDAGVRAAAALAAGQLGAPEMAPEVEALLADPQAEVRQAALLGRSLLGGEQLPAPLRAALEPQDEPGRSVVGHAALAAARFRDTSAAPAIAALLGHAEAGVRWRAAWALGELKTAGEALQGALDDADPRVRAWAALGLAQAGHSSAAPRLVQLLEDPVTDVAAAAALALGRMREASAAEPLARMARSELPRRRFAGIHGLVEGGLNAPFLTQLASDPSPIVRALAIDGLRRMRGGGGVLFTRAARDKDWHVRAAAARALSDIGDVSTLAQTIQYDEDARVVPAVLEGLARLKYRDLDTVLLKHLNDRDPVVRATAARLLAGRTIPTAPEMLIKSYELSRSDEILDAKLAILDALGRQGGSEKVINQIKQGAFENNRLVKRRAWALLERLHASEGLEPPGRQASIKTDNYYRDLVSNADYEMHATIETAKGNLVFRLYPKQATLNVRFLDELAITEFFVDKPITHFLPALELGDGDDRGDGHGYYGSWVVDEPSEVPFEKPSLTLARPLGRDSGVSQFRILFLPRPDLDGVASNVGELIAGSDVLDQLVPGDLIRRFSLSRHEFRGSYVDTRVAIGRPSPSPGQAAPSSETLPGTWKPAPTLLYLAIVGGVMFALSLLPLLVSAEKREDFPLALGVFVLIMLAIGGLYTYMVLDGIYYAQLTSERPGPRILEQPNPPVMANDQAELACMGAMAWVVLQLALLFFLVNGKPFARWLFLFLCLIEIALFTVQIQTHLPFLVLLSEVAIALNILKMWFLLMDRQTKEFLSPPG